MEFWSPYNILVILNEMSSVARENTTDCMIDSWCIISVQFSSSDTLNFMFLKIPVGCYKITPNPARVVLSWIIMSSIVFHCRSLITFRFYFCFLTLKNRAVAEEKFCCVFFYSLRSVCWWRLSVLAWNFASEASFVFFELLWALLIIHAFYKTYGFFVLPQIRK